MLGVIIILIVIFILYLIFKPEKTVVKRVNKVVKIDTAYWENKNCHIVSAYLPVTTSECYDIVFTISGDIKGIEENSLYITNPETGEVNYFHKLKNDLIAGIDIDCYSNSFPDLNILEIHSKKSDNLKNLKIDYNYLIRGSHPHA